MTFPLSANPTQLLLGLQPSPTPEFSNFVVGPNGEAIDHSLALAQRRATGVLYLWGPPGSGKTHLLAATRKTAKSVRPCITIANNSETIPHEFPPGSLIVADDVSSLNDSQQILLFRLFNSARLAGLAMILADQSPPRALQMREDLRTRIGQSLIVQLHPLTEAERGVALQQHACARGMRLEEHLLSYLLRHSRRDLPSLMLILDQLDQASLEQKRQPTLPLLREVMQSFTASTDYETGTL
jgi:DnaA family protein